MTDYNTEEGIKKYLEKGLQGLHELFVARSEAGYVRKERMVDFLVLGRWALDTCGNVGEVTTLRDIKTKQDLLGKLSLAPVLPYETIYKLFTDLSIGWELTGTLAIPKPDSVCAICRKGWTLENLPDRVSLRKTDAEKQTFEMRHKACHRLRLSVEERDIFEEMFKYAGFGSACLLTAIPNEYCPCDYCPPWFIAETPWGKIKIGWRKRVIQIEWKDTQLDLGELFATEEVTKNSWFIHAWGEEKAKEYLSKLLLALTEVKYVAAG